jgi:DnaK suppressor protein
LGVARLTPKQLDKLKKVMVARIAESFRETRSDVRDRAVPSPSGDELDPRDEGDEALRAQLADLRVSLDEREARLAQLMEEALRRMGDGTYGDCMQCGSPIGIDRLKAVPWTTRCVDCQEALEQELQSRPPTL